MPKFRVDVYTNPHKELRSAMFSLALEAAAAPVGGEQEIAKKARAVFMKVSSHARAEDTYLHPIVGPKILEHRLALEQAHTELLEQEKVLHKLIDHMEQGEIYGQGEQQDTLLSVFNHSLNRFIGHNLIHMAEEESLLPLYWEHSECYELFAVMIAFKSNEEPEAMPHIMALAQQHLSQAELIQAFVLIHDRLGEQIYNKTIAAAYPILSSLHLHKIVISSPCNGRGNPKKECLDGRASLAKTNNVA